MLDAVWIVVALVFGVAGLFWIILRKSSEKIVAQYRLLASRLDLEFTLPEPKLGGFIRPEPSLYGTHQGRELSISVPGKGLQNTRQIETVLKLELKKRNFAAQFTRTGLFGKLNQRNSRGMERWLSGDEAFDAVADVRTNDTATLDRLFDPDLRQRLIPILKEGKGSLYIGSGVMAYAELGLVADAVVRERFEAVLEMLLKLASSIEAA